MQTTRVTEAGGGGVVELKRGGRDLVGDDHETAARNSDRSYLPLRMVRGARAASDGMVRRPGGSERRGARRPWRRRVGVLLESRRVADAATPTDRVMDGADCRGNEGERETLGWPYIKLPKCMLSSQLTHMAMCCKTFGLINQ
jgi:hypothetical protein